MLVHLSLQVFLQRGCQPRFADAGFTKEQHDAALAPCGLAPAPRSVSNSSSRPTSGVKSGQRSASKRLCCPLVLSTCQAGTASVAPIPSIAPDSRSSNRLPISRLVVASIATVPGTREGLQLGGEIGRVADDPALVRLGSAGEIADNDGSRCNSDPALQRGPPPRLRFPIAAQSASPARTACSASCSCAAG